MKPRAVGIRATVGTPVSGQEGGNTRVYEPADEYKGDMAREYMYVFAVYYAMTTWKSDYAWMYDVNDDLMLQDWARTLLLKWNENDPVSVKETNRNDGIQATQKNRNPFIDLPELAAHIWGDKNTALEPLPTGIEQIYLHPQTDDDSEFVELWGNVILAPEGARIFDIGGREYLPETPLNRGIYFVTKPTFDKAVKILVNQ